MSKREAEINITGDTTEARQSIKDLERASKKSFGQMSEDAKKEADEIADAFKKTGIRMEKDIKQSTKDAKAAYKKIKNSGTASANDIKRAHESMTAKIKRNNRELKGANKGLIASFSKLKSKIATVAVVVAGAFGLKAVGEAIKFESALLDLQKVLSETDGDAKQFIGTADQMSGVFGVSSATILQSAADFKQAGFDINESFDLTNAALKLVVASELELAEASNLVVLTLNGFKAPASEAARLTNILNATSTKYATNVTELGLGMRDIAGIAKKMGFTFEETAGLLVPVISVFGSGTEAAQALKSGLLKLISTQKPVVDELQRLGIHQRELNEVTGEYTGKLRSGKDILLDVSKAFQTMDENQKIATTGILAGILQAGKMSEVFDGMGLSVEVTNNALTDTDSINKEVATRLSATETQVDRLKVAFNNMAREIGTEALPMLKGAIDFLIPLFKDMGNLGVRGILQVQKAWLEMSITIDDSIVGIAKVLDFIGITSGATDTIATDREALATKLVAIDQRLFDTSKEQREKAKAAELKLAEAKRVEIEATKAQVAAADERKAKLAEENSAMMMVLETLTKIGNARAAAARQAKQDAADFAAITFVGPKQPSAPGFNTGGEIPGYGGGDKVPIMAERGEHVLRKESVKKLGRGAAQAFNRGDIAGLFNALPVQRFAEGGEVKGGSGPTSNVNLIMNDKAFPVTAEQNVAEAFIAEIKTVNTVRGRKKQIY
ncbi:MAG: phage tail tape measure protein [Methylococcaceae bacterium]